MYEEGIMARMESMIKSEIVRLSSWEVRKVLVPLRRDVRLLKGAISQLRKNVAKLERIKTRQEKGEAETKKQISGISG